MLVGSAVARHRETAAAHRDDVRGHGPIVAPGTLIRTGTPTQRTATSQMVGRL